jgi:transglutaminase-like putative cysteine protease/Flp pilus assembly protein TadD
MPFVHHLRSSLFLFVLGLATLSLGQQTNNVSSQSSPASKNPYQLRLAASEAAFGSATPAQGSVLLNQIHTLSSFVDNPAQVTDFFRQVASDEHQSTLLRDEARVYLTTTNSQAKDPQDVEPIRSAWADELIRSAQQAVDADPSSAAAHETLAEVEQIHDRDGYSAEFEKAAQLAPTAARWVKVAESCSLEPCRFSALQHALQTDPRDAKANALLGQHYVDRRQLQKARVPLQIAIASAPADFVIGKQLADLHLATGHSATALSEYRQLEAEFPAPLWLRRELGFKYADLGLFADATRLLESLLTNSPEDPAVYKALKRVYQRTGNSAKLRDLERRELSRHPANTDSAKTLAAVDSDSGRAGEAIRTMQSLVAQHPDDSALHESLAYLYGSSGHNLQYKQELAKVAELTGLSENSRSRSELSASSISLASDRQYLANISEILRDVRTNRPSDSSNVTSLANVTVEHVTPNGQSSQHIQLVLLMNTDSGASDYSTYRIQYSYALQKLDLISARIHKPGGRTVLAESGGETGYADAPISMYYDTRQRIVHFTNLAKGDVLELEYRISPKTEVNPYGSYYGGLVTFQSSLPEKLRRYVLIAPVSETLNVAEYRMPSAASVKTDGSLRTYTWEVRNMPSLHTEPRGPSLTETAPYVNVSTFDSWQALGKWYAGFIAPQLQLDSSLRAALDKITQGQTSDLDKIHAIHRFVIENTHYVGLEFGVYSYKPYPVSQIYARRFGDCKDKASLMVALMRAAGIDADFALVRTRKMGDVGDQATSLQIFDHALVYVPKYQLWLDGTAEYAGSRELPLDDQGAMALTVGADGDAVMRRIPVTLPMENYTHRVVRASVQTDGTIAFSGSAYTRGEDAPGLRREFELRDRQRDSLRSNLAQVYPAVRVEDVHVDGANDVERDINLKFTGSINTFAGSRSLSLVSSWMPHKYTETLASLPTRTQDLRLPAPWTTEEELHFALPEGASFENIPNSTTLDTPFGVAVLRYERHGHELVVSTSVQFRQLRITPAEYPAFRSFCDDVEKAFHTEIKVRLAG